MQTSISIAPAFNEDDFCVRIHVQNSERIGAYYQFWLGNGVTISITEAQRKEILNCLLGAAPLPKVEAEPDDEQNTAAERCPALDGSEVFRG